MVGGLCVSRTCSGSLPTVYVALSRVGSLFGCNLPTSVCDAFHMFVVTSHISRVHPLTCRWCVRSTLLGKLAPTLSYMLVECVARGDTSHVVPVHLLLSRVSGALGINILMVSSSSSAASARTRDRTAICKYT